MRRRRSVPWRPPGRNELERIVMHILHLTLKKKWFDMIASGQKREEYREMKPYWHRRLMCNKKPYEAIKFRNGYSPTSPTVTVEFKELLYGLGIVEWGAPEAELVYILRLGKILEVHNAE